MPSKGFKKQAIVDSAINAFIPQEEQLTQNKLKTQGRKGMKASRINMAFTPENYDYIRVMSGIRGESMTDFVNYVVEENRRRFGDKYEQAKAIINDM